MLDYVNFSRFVACTSLLVLEFSSYESNQCLSIFRIQLQPFKIDYIQILSFQNLNAFDTSILTHLSFEKLTKCVFFYLLALQICCCNVDIKGSIYSIMNLSICNFHLNQRKRKHVLVKIVRSILLCRMSCFLYSILVGLVHSLSINQILPKKI